MAIVPSFLRLFLYDDRLELMSPGESPNTLTLETLPYRQFTRNQLLVSFLAKMRSPRTGRAFIEAHGEGVRKILSESEAHTGKRPEYRLIGQELMLTIWAKLSPHESNTLFKNPPEDWQSYTVETLRQRLFLIPGVFTKTENRPTLKLPKNNPYRETFEYAQDHIQKLEPLV